MKTVVRPDSEASPLQWPLAVRKLWIIARALQLYFVVALFRSASQAYLRGDWVGACSSLLLLVAICGYCHRFATRRVDADGIYYRRCFRGKTLAWPEIRQAQWRGGRIILLLQGRFPGRRLDFHLNPFTSVVPLLKTPRRRGDVLAAGP